MKVLIDMYISKRKRTMNMRPFKTGATDLSSMPELGVICS